MEDLESFYERHRLHLIHIEKETIVDGAGLRMSLYFAGCNHQCPDCHNQDSWNPKAGKPLNQELIETIIKLYQQNSMLSGITLTGGDPLYNMDAMYELIKILKDQIPNLNIWLYTGYTIEQVENIEMGRNILSLIDVLVDGRYNVQLKTIDIPFIGSANQRIIYLKRRQNLFK